MSLLRASRITIAIAIGVMILDPPIVDAGAVGKALSKEIAGRIAAREVVVDAEQRVLQRMLKKLDTSALQNLKARYGTFISKELLVIAKQKPSTFLEKASYNSWLRRAYPTAPRHELQGVVGDTHPLTRSVTVNRNEVNLVRTLAHERVHQVAHPRFRASFGRELDEGVTDYFASRVSGELHLADNIIGYPSERELIGTIVSRVGEKPLAKAYFRGEFDDLAGALERDIGPGSFGLLQRYIQNGDLKAVRALLLGKQL